MWCPVHHQNFLVTNFISPLTFVTIFIMTIIIIISTTLQSTQHYSGVWSSTNGGCHHQNFGDKLLFPLMSQWRHPFCKNLLHHNIFIRFFSLPDHHSIHDYLRDQAININEFTSLCTNLIRSELGIPYKVTLNVCFLESSFYSEPYFVWILFILFIYENNTFLNNYFQQIRKWFWPICSWIILVR